MQFLNLDITIAFLYHFKKYNAFYASVLLTLFLELCCN